MRKVSLVDPQRMRTHAPTRVRRAGRGRAAEAVRVALFAALHSGRAVAKPLSGAHRRQPGLSRHADGHAEVARDNASRLRGPAQHERRGDTQRGQSAATDAGGEGQRARRQIRDRDHRSYRGVAEAELHGATRHHGSRALRNVIRWQRG